MSNDQSLGCLLYRGDEKLHSDIGIVISHCVDRYESSNIMECQPRVLLPLLRWF